jgi:hypothetical protein
VRKALPRPATCLLISGSFATLPPAMFSAVTLVIDP